MIERLVLAVVLVAAVALLGTTVRQWSRRRAKRIAASIRLPEDATGSPRILAFSGPGCGACLVQAGILDELRETLQTRFEVHHIDAVTESNLARRFGVMMVPTTVVATADGRVIGINTGLATAQRLIAQLADAA